MSSVSSVRSGMKASMSWGAAVYMLAAGTASANLVTNLTQHTGYTTISSAVSAAQANDIIEVYNGTYDETITMASAKVGLTLRAAAGQKPVITPSTGSAQTAVTINCTSGTVQGFEITGATLNTGIASGTGYGYVRVIGNTIHDLDNISSPVIGFTSGGLNYQILSNTIYHLATSSSNQFEYGMNIPNGGSGASRMALIIGNVITNLGKGTGTGRPFGVYAQNAGACNILIANNTIANLNGTYAGFLNFASGTSNNVIRNNVFTYFTYNNGANSSTGIQNPGMNSIVEGNYIEGGYNYGASCSGITGPGSGCVINNNTFHNLGANNVYSAGTNFLCCNNLVIMDSAATAFNDAAGSSANTYSNNIAIGRSASTSTHTIWATSTTTNDVYCGNTLMVLTATPGDGAGYNGSGKGGVNPNALR